MLKGIGLGEGRRGGRGRGGFLTVMSSASSFLPLALDSGIGYLTSAHLDFVQRWP